MTKLVISLILGFSSLAPAATLDIRSKNANKTVVDKDRGGGNSVNGQLFDFYENEGTTVLKVKEHAVYKDYIAPIFKKLEDRLPKITAYLNESLKTKQWYLEPKEIAADDCVNSSMIKAEKKILACQSQFEVRIDSHWFADMLNKNPRQAAALIVHELLVAKMLEANDANPGYIKEESVRYLNRLFFSGTLPNAADLRDILNARNFKYFDTAADAAALTASLTKALAIVRADVQALCPHNQKSVSIPDAVDLVVRTNERSMNGQYPREQQGQFHRAGQSLFDLLDKQGADCAAIRSLANSWKILDL
jgi:hypothetical protein